ncbi:von Willebrand factor type A domain-containing protein [Schizothecium vesticola]|uniref:von Willebrand factor type A domain-containing protein n=1 Tax=Schizothecium vesticola TaxID=314040 RepID=A0AA40KC32_9PEZI|nr:von Willebrand factor type A domain-containing protein [Schizothecium vesticola]
MAHVCGLYYLVPSSWGTPTRRYLPQVSVNVHSHIIGSTSRTALSQNFVNPDKNSPIPELRYTFPLYDGVSVVSFVCTINRTRVIKGVVQERAQARKTYQAAVDRGETAGLLEQLPDASDVFTTTIGNVPAGAEIKVDIIYLGELKHDAETDGIRFTLPTSIAPRYGSYPGEMATSSVTDNSGGITIVVDAEVPLGSQIKNVQSPSHPIAVSIGNTSAGAASGADMSLQKASATLSLGTTELGADFVLHVVATNTSNPVAILETHPTIPNQRALMATLVPKFNLPPSKPEIVFLCDRSGSMSGSNVTHMVAALQVFLKSLPVGVKFNICSFGSHHTLLFNKGSRSYDAVTLKEATEHVSGFTANYGGTEMLTPLEDIFKRRYKDMDLEVFLLTDGEIWNQSDLFTMMNKYIDESKGAIRVFTLGIGSGVSHSLIEGVARAGNGFAQAVGDNEKMNSKVVRMLKASLTPHVKDYTLEVKYEKPETSMDDDDDFEIIEKVMDALDIDVKEPEVKAKTDAKKPISLFDTSANPDVEMADASLDTSAEGKYSHVPPVAEPKLLQAPFEIPPLFPFNRTSVYLLMSPSSTQRTPKSVILRGTCPSGPLELEIPVTVLPEKSETIHQLAARKAINELEEGRGWLFHAREAASGPDQGKLLKDKFEGRFSDMVEREGVRLGVTYQVGGKWCSFVAVEENGEKGEQAEEVREAEQMEMLQFGESLASSSASSSRGSVGGMKRFSQRVLHMSSQKKAAPRKAPSMPVYDAEEMVMALPDEDSDDGTLGSANSTLYFAAAPPSAPMPSKKAAAPLGAFGKAAARMSQATGLFSIGRGGANPPLYSSAAPPSDPVFGRAPPSQTALQTHQLAQQQALQAHQLAQQQALQQSQGFMSVGGGGAPPPPPPSQAYAPVVHPFSAAPRRKSANFAPPLPPGGSIMLCRETTKGSSNSAKGGGGSGSGSVAPPTPEAVLERIVERQAFDGAWQWDGGALVGLLSLNAAAVAAKATAVVRTSVAEGKMLDIAATAAVLAYLEVKLAGKKEEWEMMAEKAAGWLEEALREAGVTGTVHEMVAELKGLIL